MPDGPSLSTEWTFVGGMNIAERTARARRSNATVPFARMRLMTSEISLRVVVPGPFPRKTLRAPGVSAIWRSRGILTPGVGIASTDGEEKYFWTLRPRAVLAALVAAGYPLSPPGRPSLRLLTGRFRRP